MKHERRAFLKTLPVYAGLLTSCEAAVAKEAAILPSQSPISPRRSLSGGDEATPSLQSIQVLKIAQGFLLKTPKYSVRYQEAAIPFLEIFQEGLKVFRVPSASGISALNSNEIISSLTAGPLKRLAANRYHLEVAAQSSLWQNRRFQWVFLPDHIEFQHSARGSAPLGRCYFLSNGVSEPWSNGTSPGVDANTTVFADEYFSPAVNLADEFYFTIARPQSVGILPEHAPQGGYHPVEWTGDFAPPPLFLSFRKESAWVSIGIGARPGSYLFNALEYTGSRYAGASFYVDYLGYQTASEGFASPTLAFHFGYSQYETLEQFVHWLDSSGFATARKSEDVRWHHLPVFCGWGEQENQTRLHPGVPHDFCTQENYENWLGTLEARKLPVGTIILDDKWQSHYGTFEVDQKKWPDLKGFIARQHSAGRHVLLWVPAYEDEGLDNSLCVLEGGRPIAADVTNPRYEVMLRSRIRELVHGLGVDGFKEDWIGGVTRKPGAQLHEPVIGIEFERRFQFILYDEAHRWKPDAMIETQTPNPLFRESSDVLRLNDIWYGSRNVTQMMRRRARIAHIAGWPLVDCDDASSTDLEEWWRYMQAQPGIGIPSLYVVSRMKTTLENIPERDWVYLAALWRRYLQNVGE
jgi:Glycosyl hydrolases family 31 TIM-barrel domain